jgi:predicted phage terminase large subunit-like protein
MMIQSWDCSFKELRDSDLVCGGVLGRMGGRIFVLDLFWERAGFLKTVAAVKKMRELWPRAVSIGIEDKANGSAVIETLKTEIMGVKAIVPEGGKEARAAAAVPLVDAGDVYLPEGAPWLERWFEEFSAFPKVAHDDAVDMLSQGLRMLATGTDAMRAAVLLGMKV